MESLTVLQRAKRSLDLFEHWISERVDPVARGPYPLELAAWRREIALIRELIDRSDRVRIALIGTTGAGKSTFLNAVLGQEVLPVGVMQPCTAFVTAVSYSAGGEYWVRVNFCSRQEWRTDLEGLVAALTPGEDDEESEGRGDAKRLVEAARKRIQAVYNVRIDELGNVAGILSASLPAEAEKIFGAGSEEVKRFQNEKEMQAYLRKLIRGESALWPLVKQVSISGPYGCLADGLELIDLPGLNDPNEARVEVTREFLRTSPFVWVVFPMVRGLTDDVRRILGEEKLLRTLVLSGTYSALSLVGTKADDIDVNLADQLGLQDDCSQEELIRAYCEQTILEARAQLEQMVRDLAPSSEGGETLDRMIEIARRVRIHTTSASAYNKLKGVGRLRKDYGLADEGATGIPGVHEHLAEIGKDVGAVFNAETALKRIDHLSDEMSFFFRAKAQTPSAGVEQARARFQREREDFSAGVQGIQKAANDQLRIYRERFVQNVDPLFAASVQGVQQATQGWQAIHWATLRATVQRNGSYKSPTTARTYDLNGDLAEPLLRQLPVSWERYFTDDLERVTTEFVLKLTEAGKGFCGRIRLIVELLFHRQDESVESQLAWFQDKLTALAQASKNRVVAAVRERRSELAAKMPLVARGTMQAAYDASKAESGRGMKRRILGHIEPAAVSSAQPMYATIRNDLLEGLGDLELIIIGMLRQLTQAAEEQAGLVAHNANVDLDAATNDPVVASLLSSVPRSAQAPHKSEA